MYLVTSEVISPAHLDKCAKVISHGKVCQSDYPWEKLDEIDKLEVLKK